MKKYFKKLSLLTTVALVLLVSCSKSEEDRVEKPVSTFVLVTDELTPGDIVEIKSDKTLTFSSLDVVLNNVTIKAYKINDFSFVFTLPVIPSGKYGLKLPTIDKNLILDLTVKTYIPITNPTQVINTYIVTRNECFEEMKKNTSLVQSPTSPETLLMIDQIKQEWDYQFSKNNEKDKELLAYILQKQKISPDWFKVANDLPSNYYNKISAPTSDTGDKLVSIAKTFVTYQVLAVGSIPFVIGSAGLFIIAPNPFTAVFFLVSFSSYVVSKEAAKRRAMDVGSLKGVAEELTNFSAQKTAALEFRNNVEKKIGMSVKFRNLKNSDATIHPDIQASFLGESELILKDNEVKTLYQKALQFTEKLKGSFLSYTPAIGTTSERSMVLPVIGNEIIVKGSSEPIVSVSSKIVGDSPSIQVSSASTQDVNFNLKVAYKRKIDGQEIVKDIPSVFKANTSLKGTWLLESWGGRPAGVFELYPNKLCNNVIASKEKRTGTVVFTDTSFIQDFTATYVQIDINFANCTPSGNPDRTNITPINVSGTYSVSGLKIILVSSGSAAFNSTFVVINENKIDLGGNVYVRQ